GAAEHPDAQELLGSGVVGDLEPRLLLDHVNSCFLTPACAGLAGFVVALVRAVGPWPWLLRLLQDLVDPPALGRRQRPGLHEPDAVADAAGVLAVVCLVLLGAADDLDRKSTRLNSSH